MSNRHWVIDWAKVSTVEDIRSILICLDCRPNTNHPNFYIIKDLCKLIDDDGKRVEVGVGDEEDSI